MLPFIKQLGSTEQHSGVGIVSAPMHFPINLALMLPLNKLLKTIKANQNKTIQPNSQSNSKLLWVPAE